MLNPAELKYESEVDGWVPILAYRPKDQPDATPKIVTFDTAELAHKFVRRNVSKSAMKSGVLRGAVTLSDKTLAWVAEQNWEFDHKTWPHKMVDDPQWDLFSVIVYYQEPREQRGILISVRGPETLREWL